MRGHVVAEPCMTITHHARIERHPYLQNRAVAEFAQRHGIQLTSCMTLAYGEGLYMVHLIQRLRSCSYRSSVSRAISRPNAINSGAL